MTAPAPRAGPGPGSLPLARKLGIGEDATLVLIGAPTGLLTELPPRVVVRHRARGRADVVVAFFTRRAELERRFDGLGTLVYPAGGLWIAWPKRSSGVASDITDHVVRAEAMSRGLVDNEVCAIDGTWTGLRCVWRRERRWVEPPGRRGAQA